MTRGRFESEGVPILQLAGVDYDIFETDKTGSAKQHMQSLGLEGINAMPSTIPHRRSEQVCGNHCGWRGWVAARGGYWASSSQ